MSVQPRTSVPQVSEHAVWRFMQRAGAGAATQFDVQNAWREGYRVEVPGKKYAEARCAIVQDVEVILLRRGTHVATVIRAAQETVRFVGSPPELECGCGHRRRTKRLTSCPACGKRGWAETEGA